MGKPKLKPRNPLVALARLRKAGTHGATLKALRRQARIELMRQFKGGDRGDEGFSLSRLALPAQ